MVHHSQGYYRLSTGKHEYTIADHLGNTRVVYTDTNGNGIVDQSEILDENHYYAYGMEMSDPTFLNNSIYKYKFNGIESTESIGLSVDLALYRGLDPVLGKWYQVDPYAEAFYTMSPYCGMGNNPISYQDPDGGWIHVAVGAGIGAIVNLALHWDDVTENGSGWNWGAFAKAAGVGAVAEALTAVTGNAAAGASISEGIQIGALSAAGGDLFLQTGNAAFFNDDFSLSQTLINTGIGALGGALTSYLTKSQNTIQPTFQKETVFDEFLETNSNLSVSGLNEKHIIETTLNDCAFGVTHADEAIVQIPRLPFARSQVIGTEVINPAGSIVKISIPDHYIAIATKNGKGIIYGPPGVDVGNMGNAIRVHLNSTSYAPNGYVVFYNKYGQGFDPNTGKVLGKDLYHFLIRK